MNQPHDRAALITGCSSGLGFETAVQCARSGYGRIVVTARTEAKVETTVRALVARTGLSAFEGLALDLDSLSAVRRASDALAQRPGQFDVLILNAGIAGSDGHPTADGIEPVASSTLTGHHLLTMRLFGADRIAREARIVIAGSEAARGDVPLFKPIDVDDLASTFFSGDLEATIEAILQAKAPSEFNSCNQYATVKMFAAWWAAELATRVSAGVTVNAVSPGNTPSTNAASTLSPFMQKVFFPMSRLIPGMTHSVTAGAGRYWEAVGYGSEKNGMFFASKPMRLVGPLHQITMPHLKNPAGQRALVSALDRVVSSRMAA